MRWSLWIGVGSMLLAGCYLSWSRDGADDDDIAGDLDDDIGHDGDADEGVDDAMDDDTTDDGPFDDGPTDDGTSDDDPEDVVPDEPVPDPEPEDHPWTTEEVAASAMDAKSVALGVDASSNPHLVYIWAEEGDGDEDLHEFRYATKVGDAWTDETIGESMATGMPAVVAIDGAGTVNVAWIGFDPPDRSDRFTLNRSVRTDDGWQSEIIDGPSRLDGDLSMALDAAGAMHVAYTFREECGDRLCASVRYATNASGGWQIEDVDQEGGMAGIALDGDGSPRIAYASGALRDTVRLATSDGAQWVFEDVAPLAPDPLLERQGGGSIGVVVEPGGASDLFVPGGELVHAEDSSGIWATESIPRMTEGGAYKVEAKLGADGDLHASWIEIAPTEGRFYDWSISYSSGVTGAWSSEAVASLGAANTDVAFAIDQQGTLHLAYVDELSHVVYATRAP